MGSSAALARFDEILDRLIEREGGYNNDDRDPGGETKYGISKRSYSDVDIKALTVDGAKAIYLRDFITLHQLEKITDQRVAELILDWLVHSGAGVVKARNRIVALQKLLNVDPDGRIGPETITAINNAGPSLIRPILYDRLFFLLGLTKHPFIKGWVNRLIKLGL